MICDSWTHDWDKVPAGAVGSNEKLKQITVEISQKHCFEQSR